MTLAAAVGYAAGHAHMTSPLNRGAAGWSRDDVGISNNLPQNPGCPECTPGLNDPSSGMWPRLGPCGRDRDADYNRPGNSPAYPYGQAPGPTYGMQPTNTYTSGSVITAGLSWQAPHGTSAPRTHPHPNSHHSTHPDHPHLTPFTRNLTRTLTFTIHFHPSLTLPIFIRWMAQFPYLPRRFPECSFHQSILPSHQ
jgi:hypothetical protein